MVINTVNNKDNNFFICYILKSPNVLMVIPFLSAFCVFELVELLGSVIRKLHCLSDKSTSTKLGNLVINSYFVLNPNNFGEPVIQT